MGQRFASTVAGNGAKGRVMGGGAACLVAAGAFMLYGQDYAQAKSKDSKSDMKYKHVIIGAGVSARSCLKTLNELDKGDLPSGYDGKVRYHSIRSLFIW